MMKARIFWHNLQQCLKYWKTARSKGTLFRIADITEAFYSKKFYDTIMLFNSEQHLSKFCQAYNITDFEIKGCFC